MLSVTSSESGPIFNGAAATAVRLFINEAVDEIGDVGVEIIRSELDHVLQHPTGRYRSSIHAEGGGSRAKIVGDSLIYGAWLEGVGSRNKTTRFKGYFTFRRMKPIIEARAKEIAERVLREKYLGRMQ